MKQDKTFLLLGLGVAVWFLTRKKTVTVVDLPPTYPPVLPLGELTLAEKKSSLEFYSDGNSLNWKPSLSKMSDTELNTLYTYIFDCLLGEKKCLPSPALRQRINNLRYKYQITIVI